MKKQNPTAKQYFKSLPMLLAWLFLAFPLLAFLNHSSTPKSILVYCQPSPPSSSTGVIPWQRWISNVSIGSINNASQKEGYGNFTAQSTTVDKGSSYLLTVTPSYGWANDPANDIRWKIWIDFNQDDDFDDPGEEVFSQDTNAEITPSISIPNSATTGVTRMRITMRNGAFASPCDDNFVGEVEDYALNIQGGGTGGTCNDIAFDKELISQLATGGNYTLTVNNPGNLDLQLITEPTPSVWFTATKINNTTIQVQVSNNPNTTPRNGVVRVRCNGQDTDSNLYQNSVSGTCWTDEDAGFGKLASEIQYNPANSAQTLTFSKTQPSPYTFGEMIGVNVKSTSLNNVYNTGTDDLYIEPSTGLPVDDGFISELSSHIRAFHFTQEDYPENLDPTQSNATTIADEFTRGSINKLYKHWKTIWNNRGLDIELIAALENSKAVGNGYYNFPGKWWSESQWGATNADIYTNAQDYGFRYAETSCPNPGSGDCIVDVLEIGNEPWQYQDPETFKQIYRGISDGVDSYFKTKGINNPDNWPMRVIPGAFQAYRIEGIIGNEASGGNPSTKVYDLLGKRLPCDRKDFIQGISLHPYSFVHSLPEEGPGWQFQINDDLAGHPEDPRSLFQFLKNGVYWRNVNLPDKEVNNPQEYKAKIYASEFGWSSTTNGIYPGVGELTLGIYNLRSILMMGRLGVHRASIYEAWDESIFIGYNGYGLYTEGGGADNLGPLNKKSHFYTLINFKNQLGNTRYLSAIHDGEPVNGTNLYSYVLGDSNGTPSHIVVWNGIGMADVPVSGIAAQRNTLTSGSGTTSVDIDISALQGATVNTSGAIWLHDIPNANASAGMSINGNTLTLNASPIPVLIPLGNTTGPTCFDNIQNGNETGVDCGGPDCMPCSGGSCSIPLAPNMFFFENGDTANIADHAGFLANEQANIGDPINGAGLTVNEPWVAPWSANQKAYVDLGKEYDISGIYLYDGNGDGQFLVAPGLPSDNNPPIIDFVTNNWPQTWIPFEGSQVQVTTRYLTFTKVTSGARINEIAICGTASGSGPTCTDGIQNGNETGLDCGGPDCSPCSGGNDLVLSLTATPTTINDNTIVDVELKLTNNTGQTVSDVVVDGDDLNYNNQSNGNSGAFSLDLSNITLSQGNFNYWSSDWNGITLSNGQEATLNLKFKIRTVSLCVNGIPISASSSSNSGNSTANETINCDVNNPRLSGEQKDFSRFKVLQYFPNPAEQKLTIRFNNDANTSTELYLVNAQGKKVFSKQQEMKIGLNQVILDIKDLPTGMYYVLFEGYISKKDAIKFVKVID